MENKKAILLLSGGIDSTTLLAKLKQDGYNIIAVSFSYGQKHLIEIEFAKRNAQKYGVAMHKIIELNPIQFAISALVNDDKKISTYENGCLPKGTENTYVPFRNLVFLSQALSLAETLGVNEVFVAFNKDDSKNFWDCRAKFIQNLNVVARQGSAIQIKAPFIRLSKAEVIVLSQKLGVLLAQTISCYQPKGTTECGICLSCVTKLNAINEMCKYPESNNL